MARLWVLLAVLQAAPASWADEGRDAARAAALGRQAARAYDLQDYAGAVERLREAYRLDPKPEFLYAIGQAERMGGDCPRAIRSYQAFLRTGPAAADAERARRHIATCEAAVTPAPPPNATPAARPPSPARPPLAPPPPSSDDEARSPWPGRLLLGGGLAVAAAGAIAFAIGRARIESANDAADYRTFDERVAAARTGETLQVVGVAGMAVGGAVAGAGVAYSLWPASFHAVFHF